MSSGFENVKETHEKVISCFYLKKAFFLLPVKAIILYQTLETPAS